MIAAAAHFGDVVLLSREEPANQRALFCPPAGTLIKEVRFAGDSPLEGGVSCELVSENAKLGISASETGSLETCLLQQ